MRRAESHSVLKPRDILLHYEMACTLGFLLWSCQRCLCSAKGGGAGEDNIDIHVARSYGVTSGHLIPQMSVITVSLVAGEMWERLYRWSLTDVGHITPLGTK